jgi:hypothetical protein
VPLSYFDAVLYYSRTWKRILNRLYELNKVLRVTRLPALHICGEVEV